MSDQHPHSPVPKTNTGRFTRSMRLTRKQDIVRLFKSGDRLVSGPIAVFARPNDLSYSRLGLAVPRAAGGAVRRNRIRRLLREAFRLMHQDSVCAYDMVVRVRPHEPMSLGDYQHVLRTALETLQSRWNTG